MFHGEHRGFPKWERSGSTADLFCKHLRGTTKQRRMFGPSVSMNNFGGRGPHGKFPLTIPLLDKKW